MKDLVDYIYHPSNFLNNQALHIFELIYDNAFAINFNIASGTAEGNYKLLWATKLIK